MKITIEQHRRTPDVSLDAHVRQTQIALGKALSCRTAIYLDTKYWIILRDAKAGIAKSQAETELLRLLCISVVNGKTFCLISESIFLELMKQADPASRMATAQLIDELSLGVTLIESQMRVNTEISYFLHRKYGESALHPLEHLVWRKLSYVLGFIQ